MKNRIWLLQQIRNNAFTCAVLAVCAIRGMGAEYPVSVSGNDADSGPAASPFKTISKAGEQAQPGDILTVHDGVYLNGHRLKEAARTDQVVKTAVGAASADSRSELMILQHLVGAGKNSQTLSASTYETALDPQIQLIRKSAGWWLEMKVDPTWNSLQRILVTTGLLGKAVVSRVPYEDPDSQPNQLDTDYFEKKWPENNPSPGPFALTGQKGIRVKVWPRRTTIVGAPAAQNHAPDPKQADKDKTLNYKKVGDVELEMKITYPPDWETGGKKLPAIVLFFGGGWHAGEITQFRMIAPFLAKRGMVVVMPEYRTIQKHGVTPAQCLADAKSAIRYVRKNADALGIDASRIAAGGISAGGHLAAATAFSKGFDDRDDDLQVSCKPSALVLIVPVIDNGPGGFAHGEVKDYWQAFSPMHNIGPNPPPTLFMVGDLDKYIPVATAHRFKAEMEKHGGRCDLKIYENADHAFNFSPTGSKATQQDMDDFLVSLGYLK